MFPNSLISDSELNDAEVRLLLYYQSCTDRTNEYSSWNLYDKQVLKKLSWSQGKLKRTKSLLKEKKLLYIKQISFDKYDYYVGAQAVEQMKLN